MFNCRNYIIIIISIIIIIIIIIYLHEIKIEMLPRLHLGFFLTVFIRTSSVVTNAQQNFLKKKAVSAFRCGKT
jgi:hypothetical protein